MFTSHMSILRQMSRSTSRNHVQLNLANCQQTLIPNENYVLTLNALGLVPHQVPLPYFRQLVLGRQILQHMLEHPERLSQLVHRGQLSIIPRPDLTPKKSALVLQVNLFGVQLMGRLVRKSADDWAIHIGRFQLSPADFQSKISLLDFSSFFQKTTTELWLNDLQQTKPPRPRKRQRLLPDVVEEIKPRWHQSVVKETVPLRPKLIPKDLKEPILNIKDKKIQKKAEVIQKHLEVLHHKGHDVQKEIAETEKLITTEPGPKQEKLAKKYLKKGMIYHKNRDVALRALGGAMIILGAAIIALSLPLFAPAGIASIIGGSMLMSTGLGLFAYGHHSQKKSAIVLVDKEEPPASNRFLVG